MDLSMKQKQILRQRAQMGSCQERGRMERDGLGAPILEFYCIETLTYPSRCMLKDILL